MVWYCLVIGNRRADAFELQVQERIDDSAWRPQPQLAGMRGKTLRREGRALTDIDAVGEKEGVLLLVSCKSLVYGSDYDRGQYTAVNNARSTIDAAVENWTALTLDLVKFAGDNFDFRYRAVIGVVCTRFVVYTHNDRSLGFVAGGLRAAVSADELRRWCQGDSDD